MMDIGMSARGAWFWLALVIAQLGACSLDKSGTGLDLGAAGQPTGGTSGSGGTGGANAGQGGGGDGGTAGGPTGGSAGVGGQTGGAAGAAASGGTSGTGGGTAGAAGVGGSSGAAGASGAAGSGGAHLTNGLDEYRYRKRLTITASTAVPAAYSVYFVIDHGGLAAANTALDTGEDFRVARWTGTAWEERDRVIGLESSWLEPDTSVWFGLALPLQGQDTSYYVYYGDAGAVSPPSDPNAVFLFFDDFESGTLNRWAPEAGGSWSLATDQARSGTYALKSGPTPKNFWAVWATGVNGTDVAVDAYWRLSQTANVDVGQFLRSSGARPINHYETNYEGSPGWDIAKIVDDGWTEIVNQPPAQNPQAQQWTRITTAIVGTQMNVFRDGVALVPTTGSTDVGAELSSGTIGFRAYDIPNGQAWWIDDVRVRKVVRPEPVVEVGPEEVAPFVDP